MIKNGKKSTRGAVSVFLVIILVPCLAFTSVMIDLGRVKLAKGVAESAGDLTLNTLLANYDADLEEWYGVIASCQNIDSFYEASAKLFLRMLKSQKLESDEIYLLADYYTIVTGNDRIVDLLAMEGKDDGSAVVKDANIGDNSLANPTLFKDAIVEFMKYRAPIEITTTIINRINSDPSITDTFEAEENKPLVDSKTDFYTAEGELLSAAFNSYWAIYLYHEYQTSKEMTNDKLVEYASKISGYKTAYSEIHKLLIKNLFNTNGLNKYYRVVYELNAYDRTYTESSSEVYTRRERIDGTYHYYINGNRIRSLLNALSDAIDEFNDAINRFKNNSSAKNLMNKLPGDGQNSSYVIQWWVQMDAALRDPTSQVRAKAEAMLRAYSKVGAIFRCELEEDDANIPDNWENEANDLRNEVSTLRNKYLKANVVDNNDDYLKMVNKLEQISQANINKIKPSGVSVTVDGRQMTVSDAIPYIKSKLEEIKNEIQPLIDLLDTAIYGNEDDNSVSDNDKVKSLDELYSLAQRYQSTLFAWSNQANSSSTDMAEDDRQEIEELNEEMASHITGAAVQGLKTRLLNIKAQYETITSAIDNMKYGNSSVVSIPNFNAFKEQASIKVSASQIKLTNGELASYSESTFNSLFKPTTNPALTMQHLNDRNYDVIIDPDEPGAIQHNTPELFLYFHSRFKGLSKQDIDGEREDSANAQNEAENVEKDAKDKDRYHGDGTDIEKDFSGDAQFSFLDSAFGSAIDIIRCLKELNINSIRDDLYVTAYIMDMFSYATFEEEGIYSLLDEETRNSLYVPHGDGAGYRPTQYEEMLGSADTEHSWLSEALTDAYNKSLTNKLINKENNAAYEAEVEYILFGKDNATNVKSVYDKLYVMRYALNLVSAFKNFWNGSDLTSTAIQSVAAGVQFVSGGIIPIPVTKIVILPILTIFETARDMQRLEAGMPVELFKSTYDQWWVCIHDDIPSSEINNLRHVGELLNYFKNSTYGPNKGKGLFYSDYLTLFVYLGLKSSCANDMYKRMAEVIQSNMRLHVNGGSDGSSYTLKKSKLYFTLEATVRVDPLMITLPIFSEYDDKKPQNDDWCTFTVTTTRGYS